jgi:hypothetical protein
VKFSAYSLTTASIRVIGDFALRLKEAGRCEVYLVWKGLSMSKVAEARAIWSRVKKEQTEYNE